MRNLFLLTLFSVLLISTVQVASAINQDEVDYEFKFGDQVSFKHPCFNNGTFCDSTFACNISIYQMPNLQIVTANSLMTRTPTYYSYNVTSLLNNGLYKFDMACVSGSLGGSDSGYFLISPTGDDRGTSIPIFLLLVSLGVFALSVFIKNEYVGFISSVLLMITGVYIMIYGITNLADLYTRSIAIVTLVIGIFAMLTSAYEVFSSSEEEDTD